MKEFLNITFFCVFIFMSGPLALADPLQELYTKGQQEYQAGNYQQAIKYFEQVVDLDPNFAPVYNFLGLAHDKIGSRLSDIVWFFKVAADLDPKFGEAYENMCKTYYQAAEFDLAEKACQDALAIKPSLGSAQLTLAWIYLTGKNKPYDAIQYFRLVLERVQNPTVYFGLGMAYSMAGDNAQVLETITILRGMGEVDLAAQLEQSIRRPDVAPAPDQKLTLPQSQKGQLIEANPKSEPQITSPDRESSPISGQMRIRLKGRLFGDQDREGTSSEE